MLSGPCARGRHCLRLAHDTLIAEPSLRLPPARRAALPNRLPIRVPRRRSPSTLAASRAKQQVTRRDGMTLTSSRATRARLPVMYAGHLHPFFPPRPIRPSRRCSLPICPSPRPHPHSLRHSISIKIFQILPKLVPRPSDPPATRPLRSSSATPWPRPPASACRPTCPLLREVLIRRPLVGVLEEKSGVREWMWLGG